MKQIIPFKKDLPFKTKVSEITSISLERELKVDDEGIVSGVFHITGDYKMNEGSINRESFSFDLPFDITLDPRYDIETVTSDIEDFYYDVENEDTLKVNIDLFVEAEYLPEKELEEVRKVPDELTLPDEYPEDLQIESKEDIEAKNIMDAFKEEVIEPTPVIIEKNFMNKIEEQKERDDVIDMPSLAQDLFSNLDDTETYTTYYVYIVKEYDTIDKILTKYVVTKEDLESYNDIASIKPGDKVIVPKTNCE